MPSKIDGALRSRSFIVEISYVIACCISPPIAGKRAGQIKCTIIILLQSPSPQYHSKPKTQSLPYLPQPAIVQVNLQEASVVVHRSRHSNLSGRSLFYYYRYPLSWWRGRRRPRNLARISSGAFSIQAVSVSSQQSNGQTSCPSIFQATQPIDTASPRLAIQDLALYLQTPM